MTDIADPTEYDRTRLALALAGLSGDTAHVRDACHAIDDKDIAGPGQIVGLKFGHLVHVSPRGFIDMLALDDIAHRERRSDNARAGYRRLQHGCADDTRHAKLVHGVGNNSAGISKRPEA